MGGGFSDQLRTAEPAKEPKLWASSFIQGKMGIYK
jgi:hypothetical protein